MRENQQSEPHPFIHMKPLSRNPGSAPEMRMNHDIFPTKCIRSKPHDQVPPWLAS